MCTIELYSPISVRLWQSIEWQPLSPDRCAPAQILSLCYIGDRLSSVRTLLANKKAAVSIDCANFEPIPLYSAPRPVVGIFSEGTTSFAVLKSGRTFFSENRRQTVETVLIPSSCHCTSLQTGLARTEVSYYTIAVREVQQLALTTRYGYSEPVASNLQNAPRRKLSKSDKGNIVGLDVMLCDPVGSL